MAVATGSCPSCGAPVEFGLGSSIAKICEYCRATVCRTDRGLENLGKVAEIANTPSLVAVGDHGTIDERAFEVYGRVQLDHGRGPWDEYYVAFDHGESWGWLSYAEGHWLVTSKLGGLSVPPFESLQLEQDLELAGRAYRVKELKVGRVVSSEGELPSADPPDRRRYYADLLGKEQAFATIDYGENRGNYEVFGGWVVDESRLVVTQAGPRTIHKVKSNIIKCPNCGGDVPKLGGDRSKRLGCPYCGAVSDIALQQIVAQQEAALGASDIPIGSKGSVDGREYVCLAYLRRSADFDGERFSWDEYLLFSEGFGYRWAIKDETTWLWTSPVNIADVELAEQPVAVSWGTRRFQYRNMQRARIDYVLGELYWQASVGDEVWAKDYAHGRELLSREEAPGEVSWSYSVPTTWDALAGAFGLPRGGPGSRFATTAGSSTSLNSRQVVALVVIVILLLICCAMCSSGSGGRAYSRGGATMIFGGASGFYGGK
jgi:hypothetical protein